MSEQKSGNNDQMGDERESNKNEKSRILDIASSFVPSERTIDQAMELFNAVGTVADAVKPFVPLIAIASYTIAKIIETYENAQMNRKICGVLLDRVYIAEINIKQLKKRAQENEEKFQKQSYYTAMEKFIAVLKRIKVYLEEVSQLQGLRKLVKTNNIRKEFESITTEFNAVLMDLEFSLTLDMNLQSKKDAESLTSDLEDLNIVLKNIQGGVVDASNSINVIFEEISSLKNNQNHIRSLEAYLLSSDQLIDPHDPLPTDSRKTIVKKMFNLLPVAVKVIKNTDDLKKPQSSLLSELALLKKLHHATNVIKFYGIAKMDTGYYTVYEWAEGGNLKEYYENHKSDFTWDKKLSIALDILRGIQFLHGANVLHHDIRCENILLSQNLEARLTRFHMSREFGAISVNIKTDIADLVRWMAPEKMDSTTKYSLKCETFSYAMLLWECCHQRIPYADTYDITMITDHVKSGRRENFNWPLDGIGFFQGLTKIIRKAWSHDPKHRPTIWELYVDLFELQKKYYPPRSESPYIASHKASSSIPNIILSDTTSTSDLILPSPSQSTIAEFNISTALESPTLPHQNTLSSSPPLSPLSPLSLSFPLSSIHSLTAQPSNESSNGSSHSPNSQFQSSVTNSSSHPTYELPQWNLDELVLPVKPMISIEDGIKAHKTGDRGKAWECFREQSEIGNFTAKYWKAYYLWEGYIVQQNRVEAVKLFKEAADNGIPDAQLRYAFCLVQNEGGAKFNLGEFLKYLKASADNNNATAQFNLGDVYYNGKLNVPKNIREGKQYLRLAALQNQPNALKMVQTLKIDIYD
ncbi:10658_t:CDS:2 [Acaulospora morrowiae]|uniref:10658_t:CDS:1 n=1 Tax=Acaulospora morrowiae TaxID=94023 RepID=A0A9N8WEC2_9GLOM|nr:10658_t:CDS:2 [Acaulospora morrowiae]